MTISLFIIFQIEQLNIIQNTPCTKNKFPNFGGGESSNEEEMQNSSKTLIEYTPFKNNNTKAQTSNIEFAFNVHPATKPAFIKPNNFNLNSSLNLNEDISDLIEALKTENQNHNASNECGNKPKRPPLSQKNSNFKSGHEEGNNNVNYSFSSRPKPAPLLNGRILTIFDYQSYHFISFTFKLYYKNI